MARAVRSGVVRARGLEFPTLEAGDGPLVLCLHGFPDHLESFRHQLPVLAAAGFRAVAPCMRGYAPSAIPKGGGYQTAALAEDAIAIIEALGYDDAVVFGHDWGALAAYGAALAAPQRVRALVTAAIPYGPQFMTAFTTNYTQQRRSWYMFFFQTPFAEAAVAYDDFAFLERLWADWSPEWRWPEEAMMRVKETFRRPGVLEAALGYYRAAFNPALQDPRYAVLQGRMLMEPIDVPAMVLHGADDGCIGVELLEGMDAFFLRELRVEIVPGTGHFLHQEAPDAVNRLILDFLRA
ncbi:MAG: alpha/beta hydrolase [Deltaproteobacteria bacterium]|nr:alpha/beta hydrolase [Deltaproteobacteria bacterium]